MKIDNSAFQAYMFCPLRYFERYEADSSCLEGAKEGVKDATELGSNAVQSVRPVEQPSPNISGADSPPDTQHVGAGTVPRRLGLELRAERPGRDFGTRLHQLLHERRLKQLGLHSEPAPEWPDESIESECQSTLAQYEAHWIRDYRYLESEKVHEVPIPPALSPSDRRHSLLVKLDAVVSHGDGTVGPFDTKTESRPGYNTREDWAGRTQAKAYLWALQEVQPERVSRLVVDVVTRGGPKRAPLFYRHDDISAPQDALHEAIRNIAWVADDIERSRESGWWRSNMNACKRGWEKCDFFALHVIGRTEANLRLYKPADDYLSET